MPACARNPFFSAGYIAFQGDGDFFAATPSLPLTIFSVEAPRGGTGRRPTGRAIAASWPGSTSIFTPDPRPGTGRWRPRQVDPRTTGPVPPAFGPEPAWLQSVAVACPPPKSHASDPDFPASKTEAGSRPHKARHSPNSAIYPPRILASHPRTRLKRRH